MARSATRFLPRALRVCATTLCALSTTSSVTPMSSRYFSVCRSYRCLGVSRWISCIRRRAARVRLRNPRSEEHTSELQSRLHLVCRLLLEKKKKTTYIRSFPQTSQRFYPNSPLTLHNSFWQVTVTFSCEG